MTPGWPNSPVAPSAWGGDKDREGADGSHPPSHRPAAPLFPRAVGGVRFRPDFQGSAEKEAPGRQNSLHAGREEVYPPDRTLTDDVPPQGT